MSGDYDYENEGDQNDRDGLEERIEQLESQQQAHEENSSAGPAAYLMGTALAMILSWSRNFSILWCIGHGLLSWLYVIYFAFTRG